MRCGFVVGVGVNEMLRIVVVVDDDDDDGRKKTGVIGK